MQQLKITTIHSPWMNSLMLYQNLMIQLLAQMMSTTKCLNTSLMMLFSFYSTFLITSGLRENSLQAGLLLQLYQFLNPVKIHLTRLTIAQLLWQVAFASLQGHGARLVWYLERNKLISPMQCGFRKQRSTTDHLVRLESFVREAFAQRQHAVGVFFDLIKSNQIKFISQHKRTVNNKWI